jgi:hypothetical protein
MRLLQSDGSVLGDILPEKLFGYGGELPGSPAPQTVSAESVTYEILTPGRRTGTNWGSGTTVASRRQIIELYNRSLPFRRVVQAVSTDHAAVDWKLYAIRVKPSKRLGKAMLDIGRSHVRAAQKALSYAPSEKARAAQWKSIDASDTVERTEILDHPMLDIARGMFSGDPDLTRLPILNGAPAVAMWAVYHIVIGETFELLIPNKAGVPGGVLALAPHWIQELPAAADQFYRVQIPGGSHWRVPAELMTYGRQADPMDPHGRGLGAGLMVAPELELDREAANAIRLFFAQGMLPQVLLTGPGVAKSVEMRESLYEDWGKRMAGEHNRWKGLHGINTAAGGVNVTTLDQDFQGARMAELRTQEWQLIRAAIPGVPAEILGELGDSNRATSYNARIIYRERCQMPLAESRRRQVQELAPMYNSAAPLVLEAIIPEPVDEEARQVYAALAPWAVPIAEHARRQGAQVVEGTEKIYVVPAGLALRTEEQMLKPPEPLAPVEAPGGPADAFMDEPPEAEAEENGDE